MQIHLSRFAEQNPDVFASFCFFFFVFSFFVFTSSFASLTYLIHKDFEHIQKLGAIVATHSRSGPLRQLLIGHGDMPKELAGHIVIRNGFGHPCPAIQAAHRATKGEWVTREPVAALGLAVSNNIKVDEAAQSVGAHGQLDECAISNLDENSGLNDGNAGVYAGVRHCVVC